MLRDILTRLFKGSILFDDENCEQVRNKKDLVAVKELAPVKMAN